MSDTVCPFCMSDTPVAFINEDRGRVKGRASTLQREKRVKVLLGLKGGVRINQFRGFTNRGFRINEKVLVLKYPVRRLYLSTVE